MNSSNSVGEVAQELRETLSQNPGLSPSIHMEIQNHLMILDPGDLTTLLAFVRIRHA